mgnify:CR=1 FL=1
MRLTIQDNQGQAAGELEVSFPLPEGGKGTQAVHDVVVAHLANRRQGNASTKTMGDVSGTGRKPWRQKGTGRARAGSFQSPLWVGGGVVFGPKPRAFGRKISRTTKVVALRKALSERLKAGDVVLVDGLSLSAPKTRELAGILAALQLQGSLLVVCEGSDKNLQLASRNLPKVEVTTGNNLNTYQVLRYDKLLFTRPAFEQVEQRLK